MRVTLVIFLVLLGWRVSSQPVPCCTEAVELIALIHANHIQPVPQDSLFEKQLFEEIFQTLDPQRKLFSRDDLNKLIDIRKSLLNRLKNNDSQVLTDIGLLYKNKITEYENWITRYMGKPLDFSTPEFFDVFHELKERPANSNQLLQHRQRLIKFEVLEKMNRLKQVDTLNKNFVSFERDAREAWLQVEKKWLEKVRQPPQGLNAYVMHAILKSIAKIYDPHTDYFSSRDAQDFKSSLSDRMLDFGFAISENDKGEIIIDMLTPGGPAWNSNEINPGDLLTALINAKKQTIDFSGLTIEEAYDILEGTDITEAEIIIQKPDGQTRNVFLTKEEIENSENVVKGFILNGKNKIGYINLPAFYTQWENEKAQGCAADVAREILKLKKEKIEGLILDLRYNGGGALYEALELTGIFIDSGPLILYQNRQEPVITIKDPNKGTIYDGPLIVLVNGFSASASELLAATLQDYNRALIVGSPTFGKATGQEILPFPAKPPSSKSNTTESSAVKVTTDKLYRITGKSYQHRGVKPDISMPDITISVPYRESYYRNSIKVDSITKKTYYTPAPPLPVHKLKTVSEARQQNAQNHKLINNLAQHVVKPVPLTFADYIAQKQTLNDYYAAYDALKTASTKFKAQATAFDKSLLTMDTHRNEQQKQFASQLEESVYINETFLIMCDFISLKKQ